MVVVSAVMDAVFASIRRAILRLAHVPLKVEQRVVHQHGDRHRADAAGHRCGGGAEWGR